MVLEQETLLGALLWIPRRLALWASENPLRAAGGAGALVASLVILASLSPGVGVSPDFAGITLDRLWRFSVAHPAYPAAVLIGGGALLLMR
jgi:hypothetical protein